MPRQTSRAFPFFGSRCRLLAGFAAALLALLSVAPHRVHAQDVYKDHPWHEGGRGRVEVDTSSLTVDEGGTVRYRLRLSKAPILSNEEAAAGKTWVVRLHVDGITRFDEGAHGYDVDGDGETDITWRPNYYREFDLNDWNRWKDVRITAHPDSDGEDQQITFRHEVWAPGGACPFLGASVTVRVNDTTNEPVTVSVADATPVDEGETAVFNVRLNKAASQTVTVEYRTADGTAKADSDYHAESGTLTFRPGRQDEAVHVRTVNDNVRESTEDFRVTLRNASGAAIRDGTATGTIDDDDAGVEGTASLTISNVTVTEGDPAVFTARLAGNAAQSVTVRYDTVDGTAVAGSDYTDTSGSLTLAPGGTETISVDTTEDTDAEPAEMFSVTLTDSGNVVVASATGTINDDDGVPPPPPPPPPPPLPILTFSDTSVEVEEGDAAEFTVTVSGTRTGDVTVSYSTADGSATDGDDYTGISSGTLTFTPSESSKTISVATIEDTDPEDDETFTVTLSSPEDATIENGTATGTINDDDDEPPPPTLPILSIADAEASEGDNVVFTVTLGGTRTGNVTVAYATADGTAEEGDDYDDTTGTLTFTPTEEFHTISVPTLEDTDPEDTETFTLTLSNPNGATIVTATATGTINDDDEPPPPPLPTLSIAGATVEEGDTAAFQVTLTGTRTGDVTVAYTTADGSAVVDDDYTRTSGTLTFTPTESSKAILVPTVEDTAQEETETFTVTLSSPGGATIVNGTATGTINDDDGDGPPPPPPTLSIEDATVEEGNAAAFEVTLSAASAQTVSVAYATADGTAREASDYAAEAGTLVFQPGEDAKTITVRTTEDTVEEETETFTVSLSSPSGATIDDGTATGTITDDDGPVTPPPGLPALSIEDATVEEGGAAAFEVTLSAPGGQTVTVAYATADGTAVEDDDYTAASGTLTFAPGEQMMTITVRTTEDTVEEETETFTVSLSSPSGATIDDGTATGTITDDDRPVTPPPGLPALSIEDATVEEGGAAAFEVTLSEPGDQTVTVAYATADGTAVEDDDYTAASDTLTFAPGEQMMTITVRTTEDTVEEETETFTVSLSSPSGATIDDGTATGTITDDDRPVAPPPDLPALSIADATVEEGGAAAFEVNLSEPSDQTVTVAYATADGTAVEDDDYTAASDTLTFAPGEQMMTITVRTTEDTVEEETETFTVSLSSPSGATIDDGTATGTITDDDRPVAPPPDLPALSIADATVEEGGAAAFEVNLSEPSDQTVTVAYATADGTALEDSDYTSVSGTLTFAPGEELMTISVQTTEDDVEEDTETFTVTLSGPTGATIADADATGTIIDDDKPVAPPPTLPALTIRDAEATEGETAEFLVTLSPASDETVTVSFRTVDGTAMAGLDYTPTMGTLRFEPGEAMATIGVSTLTDELAEGIERFTMELSDPVGATVSDGTGVGAIADDHTARISTVNRTVLPEVGRALAFSAVTCRFDRTRANAMAADGRSSLSLSPGLLAGRRTPSTVRWNSPADRWSSPADPRTSPAGSAPSLEQALGNSSFLMPAGDGPGGTDRYTTWGCADYRHLSSSGNQAFSWSGVAFSAQVGFDVALGADTLAGVSVSRSRSAFGYYAEDGAGMGGANELRLTGVHPYVAWSASPDLVVWGTVGHGWGDFQVDDHLGAGMLRGAAALNTGSVGVNGRLLERGATTLRVRSEGGLARLGMTGDMATLETVDVDLRRLRLAAEASHEHLFPFGSTLTPWAEVGLRHDGGDGETGAGLEIRAGVRYRDLPQGLTIEGYGRRLVVHQGTVQESGFGAVLRVDPGESGLGPSMSLTPAWGATAGGVHRLWERGANAFSMSDTPGAHMNAQFAYGLPALGGGGLLTPFGLMSLAREDGRSYGLGATLAVGRTATLSLEAERRRRLAARATHAIMLRGMLQF